MNQSPVTDGEIDRRPLQSRDTRVARGLTTWLVAKGIGPNTISTLGMVAGVFGGAAFAATAWDAANAGIWWLLAAALTQLRLLCNMLDGMVAIAAGTTSKVGELFNEAPDRVSDTATLVGLGYAAGGDAGLGFVAALLAMFTAYVRALGKGAGAGSEFCGPMAKPHRMFAVTVLALAMALLPTDWRGESLPTICLWVLVVGTALTAVRRLWRVARKLRGSAS